MKLTKQIPARTKTLQIRWLKAEFLEMNPEYRRVRARVGKAMDTCYWCGYAFRDGDMTALAGTETRGNVLLCQTCAEAARAE